jgi:hypothetical protein
MPFRRCACGHVSALLPLDALPWIWCRELSWNSVEKIQISFKSDKISESLHEDISTLYCCWRNTFAIKVLCASAQYSCIVDKTHRTQCCFSIAAMVTSITHSFVSYEHCLCEWHPLVKHKNQRGGTDCQLQLHLLSIICCIKVETRSQQKKPDIKCSCDWRSVHPYCSFTYCIRCLPYFPSLATHFVTPLLFLMSCVLFLVLYLSSFSFIRPSYEFVLYVYARFFRQCNIVYIKVTLTSWSHYRLLSKPGWVS